VLRGIRRTIGTAPERKSPATADVLAAMLQLCPNTPAGRRDRALLGLGFAGTLRRSELVALEVEDLSEVPDGLRVRIRRSETDQTGEGAEIVIPRGLRIRPVEAVQTWLQAAGITEGLLFCAVATPFRLHCQVTGQGGFPGTTLSAREDNGLHLRYHEAVAGRPLIHSSAPGRLVIHGRQSARPSLVRC
jgi:hypothetical protein